MVFNIGQHLPQTADTYDSWRRPITETQLQARVRAILCAPGSPVRLWRNNVGNVLGIVQQVLGKVLAKYGIPGHELSPLAGLKFGLGVGSADLIGLITGSGRFLGVEIKLPGRVQTPEQKAWQNTIQSFGGVAIVIRSETEAEEFLKRVKGGEV